MVVLTITTTAQKVIEHNEKRKFIEFTNTHATQVIYLSDEPGPTSASAKWAILATKTLRIDREEGFPERAFYAIASGAGTGLAVGGQNEE